jgi:hypothetical protein
MGIDLQVAADRPVDVLSPQGAARGSGRPSARAQRDDELRVIILLIWKRIIRSTARAKRGGR